MAEGDDAHYTANRLRSASGYVISLRQIQAIVRQYPVKFQPTRIEPLGAAGGMSGAQFWRIESAAGTFVLRRWPSEHPTAERLRFIHSVLFQAEHRGVSILATPIRTTTGESFTIFDGHLWDLTPWMTGMADYERSPNKQKLNAAMTSLAKFHSAISDFPIMGLPQVAARRLPSRVDCRGFENFHVAERMNWPTRSTATSGQSLRRWVTASSIRRRDSCRANRNACTAFQHRIADTTLHSRYLACPRSIHRRRRDGHHRFRGHGHRHAGDRCGSAARQPCW